jgi:hypothetical protein
MNSLYIIALKAMEELKVPAGDTSSDFSGEIRSMQEATWREFCDPADGFLRDCREYVVNREELDLCGVPDFGKAKIRTSRVAQALALLAGMGSDPARREILEKDLMSKENFDPELFYGSFLLLAMKKQGLFREALEHIRHFWGPILDSGCSTIWENGVYFSGKAGFGGSASLCHGFSTSPADFLQTVLLGVSPAAPGFAEFRFDPVPCGLSFARGTVPTPHGLIHAEWVRKDDTIRAVLLVPEHTLAHTQAGDFGPGEHEFSWKDQSRT